MFQADALMPWRSALGNVMLGLQYRGDPEPEARALAAGWLERVGLGGFADRYPHQLSGGMRKRAALAQVLALDPDIVLMDEPFSALDVQTRQLMENEVLALWAARPRAVLFITHDLDEAIALSDRVVVLSAGPETHPIGEFEVDLPRPRDVAEVRQQPRFVDLHGRIWAVLRDQVLESYARSEEHTSELQSPLKIVCRLLLEKKKKPSSSKASCRRLRRSSAMSSGSKVR